MANACSSGLNAAACNAVDGAETLPDHAVPDRGAGWLAAIALRAGVAASDIVASRVGDDLVLRLRGSTHAITVADYFRKNAAGGYVVEEVRWLDGMLWNLQAWRSQVPVASAQ